jgi:hypothetical protein
MTEAEWLTCQEPQRMLASLQEASGRRSRVDLILKKE